MSKIKTFKEYIKENLWADLQDRSSGEVIRKEDDIDHLYNKDLCEYIKERYQAIFNRHFDIEYFGQSVITSRIHIPLYVTTDVWNPQHLISLVIFREPDDFNRTVEIHLRQKRHLTATFKYFFDKLKNEFDLVVKEGTVKISPKDGGKITNIFFISVLDFCIDNLEKITVKSKYTARLNITRKEVNENLWADLQDRSSGEVIRKEDDINILNGPGMLEYIFNHYVIQDNFSQPQYYKDANVLTVPILKVKENGYRTSVNIINYAYDKDSIYIRETLYNDVLIKIKKEFNISNFWNGVYTIKNADNSLFIKLIDFIIDNVDPMSKTVFALLHKRKMNENLWADLQDRGSGEVVRKEDYITTREELKDIIKSAYEEQGKGDTLTLDFTGKKILVEDLSDLFYGLKVKKILGLETWDMSNVKNMSGMFCFCYSLTKLDIGNWDVSNVANMSSMFYNCQSLTKLDIGGWNTSKVKDMSRMFNYCHSLTKLDIGNWDVSKVTNMANIFNGCKNLTELNIGNWNVSKVTNMYYMFSNCYSLTKLDIGNWNTSKVIRMDYMFDGCKNLTELNIGGWDVSQVKTMDLMFCSCEKLKELDLNKWNVNEVKYMSSMFYGCKKLIKIDIGGWNTSKVANMSYMFYDCNSLKELNIENWDVSQVKNMEDMLYKCPVKYIKKGNKLIRK